MNALGGLDAGSAYLLLCLVAIGQEHILAVPANSQGKSLGFPFCTLKVMCREDPHKSFIPAPASKVWTCLLRRLQRGIASLMHKPAPCGHFL